MIKLVLMALLLLTPAAQAETTPYLLEQIQKAQPDATAIEKARKQVADLKEIKLKKISLVPFHLREKNPINESNGYCSECHGSIPHLKSLRSRAFLNMHTDYVACETCHFRPENTPLQYAWFDYNLAQVVAGVPECFHSGRKKEDKKPWVSRDGHLKIVPILNQQAVIATRTNVTAKALYKQWKDADKVQKGLLKAQYHQPLKTKGPECSACHNDLQNAVKTTMEVDGKVVEKITKPPLLDYLVLGATPVQQTAIRQNSIADFFGHYQPEATKVEGEGVDGIAHDVEVPKDPTKEERIRITNFLK
ncbi:MAG: hypothetical protein ABL903_07595 [Methylococcales bacterium]